jgi:hypothetical protein
MRLRFIAARHVLGFQTPSLLGTSSGRWVAALRLTSSHPDDASAARVGWWWGYCWTTSTRRFWARPASSPLEAMGESEAMPRAVRRAGATW